MESTRRVFGRDGAEFGRGLGFFDAIFGFAITLLIANVDLPPAEAWASIGALLAHGLGVQLAAFALSFAVIALFWRRNTELIGRFRGLDGTLITANLVTVALVVLLPFTTQGISDPGLSDLPLPVALYAGNVAFAIASLLVTLEIGRARGLEEDPPSPRVQWAERIDFGAQVLIFAASIPVAYLAGPGWGMTVWAALILVAPLTGRRIDRLLREDRARSQG